MITRANETEFKYIDPSDASNYTKNNDIQFLHAQHFIDEFGSVIKSPILDIGSGDGKVTAYISKTMHTPIMGIDISQDRVTFANNFFANQQTTFLQGDVITLDKNQAFKDRKFGTVVSFNTLHHVPKNFQLRAFTNIRKVLDETGVALFLMPGKNPDLHNAIDAASQMDKWKIYFTDFKFSDVRTYENPVYYRDLCRAAGFLSVYSISEMEEGSKALTADEMANFLKGWLPHLAHLKMKNVDQHGQDNFLKDIVRLYFQKSGATNDSKVNPLTNVNKVIAFVNSSATFFKKASVIQKPLGIENNKQLYSEESSYRRLK